MTNHVFDAIFINIRYKTRKLMAFTNFKTKIKESQWCLQISKQESRKVNGVYKFQNRIQGKLMALKKFKTKVKEFQNKSQGKLMAFKIFKTKVKEN